MDKAEQDLIERYRQSNRDPWFGHVRAPTPTPFVVSEAVEWLCALAIAIAVVLLIWVW